MFIITTVVFAGISVVSGFVNSLSFEVFNFVKFGRKIN